MHTAPAPHLRYRADRRRRFTPRTRALLDALEHTDAFLTAAQLHDVVMNKLGSNGMGVGLATVYRTLGQLSADGCVDVVRDDLRGEHRYRLGRHDGQHRYLVCRQCWRAIDIDTDPADKWAATIGQRHGFVDITVTVELFGRCDRCQPPHPIRTHD